MKKVKIYSLVTIILIVIIVIFTFNPNSKNKINNFNFSNMAIPTPVLVPFQSGSTSDKNFNIDQKTIIGQTTDSQVATLAANKQTENNMNIYSINNSSSPIPDTIMTQNNKVIYENNILLYNPNLYTNINDLTNTAKNPEKIINLNRYNGDASTYLYPSHGFNLIVNPETGEIYEIERYVPMSLAQYLNTLGKNLPSATNGLNDDFNQ